jgi:hypothetical protein
VALAQRDYSAALTEAKAALVALVEDVAADPLLQQNVDWGLNNSITKRLQRQLTSNKMDALYLTTGDCTPLALAKMGKTNFQDCAALQSATGFHWYLSEQKPILAFTMQLKRVDHDVILIQGHVALDEAWRNQLAFMSSPWNRDHLIFEPWNQGSEVLPIVQDGPTKSRQMVASISYRSNLLDSYLGQVSGTPQTNYHLPILLLLGALLIIVLIQLSIFAQERSLATGLRKIQECLAIGSLPNGTCPSGSRPTFVFHQVTSGILKAIKENRQVQEIAILSLEKKIMLLSEEKSRLDSDHSSLTGRFSELNRMESLGIQLARSSSFISDTAAGIQETAQDMRSILTVGLEQNCKFVCDLMMDWKEQIQTRGARKFLRSLSETESETSGSSLLDQQVDAVIQRTQGLADQAIGAKLHNGKIIDKSAGILHYARRWKELIEKKNEAGATSLSLKKLATEINELLHADSKVYIWSVFAAKDYVFPNQLDVPLSVLVSAMYHAVLATYLAADSSEAIELSLHFRKMDGANMILISPPGQLSEVIAFGNPAGKEQLNIIKRLLSPFGIQCENIRLNPGIYPITFRWTDKVISETKSSNALEFKGANSNSV